jgi:proline iminopeptidase
MLEDAYRVIRFEQRGCGRSTADGTYDLQTVLRDMEAIREAYDLDEWIVGGHSWGADVALIYALEYPRRTQSVIFMAGIGLHQNKSWVEAMHANRAARGEELPPMAYPFNDEVNEMGNQTRNAYVQQPMLYAKLAKLRIPVLFLCGGQAIRPQWPAEQLHNLVPGSTFRLLPNAAHCLWLHEPEAVRKELRGFLKII